MKNWQFKRNGECIAPDGVCFALISKNAWGHYTIKYPTLNRGASSAYLWQAKDQVRYVYEITRAPK